MVTVLVAMTAGASPALAELIRFCSGFASLPIRTGSRSTNRRGMSLSPIL